MLSILIFIISTVYAINMNEFTGTVDIQDKGRMGMGKNAASWSRSVSKKYDVFYYLTMQPWRNLEWTTVDSNFVNTQSGDLYTQVIFNQDYDRIQSDSQSDNMCRKKIGYPIREYQLDWSLIPTDTSNLEIASINGLTCYKYAAKPPLNFAYFLEKVHDVTNKYAEGMSPCRFEYIGGRTVTFRSSSEFSTNFIGEYNKNNITKCAKTATLPPTNNVAVGLVVNLDMTSTLRNIFSTIVSQLINKFASDVKFSYYINSQTPLSSSSLISKSEMQNVLNSVSTMKKGNEVEGFNKVYEQIKNVNGKNIIYLSKYVGKVPTVLDNAFKNNVTVYVVNLDSSLEEEYLLQKIVNKGEHYFKSTVSTLGNDMKLLYNTIMANMTELCDRSTCKGFCDGGARCTCPMCCHSNCYYTTCNTDRGECVYFPSDSKKKAKRTCPKSCLGDTECDEEVGCIVKNNKCISSIKCLEPYCLNDNCAFRSNCTDDSKPSIITENGKEKFVCQTYSCNRNNGECDPYPPKASSYCPTLPSKCHEYYCSNGECKVQEKKCIKVSPYEENPCYEAKCDATTGNCVMNLVGCSSSGVKVCGKINGNCYCDASTSYKCKCESTNGCKENEVCDYTGTEPQCTVINENCASLLGKDINWDGCYKSVCIHNETSGEYYISQEEYDCNAHNTVPQACEGIARYICSGNRQCTLVTTNDAMDQCLVCQDGKKINKCEGKTTSQGIPLVCKDGECVPPESYDCKDLFINRLDQCQTYYEWSYQNGECKVVVKDGKEVELNSLCQFCQYDNILTDPAKMIKLDCENQKNNNGIPYVCRDGSCHIDDNFNCSKHENFPIKCIDILEYVLIEGSSFDEYRCEWKLNQTTYKSECRYCNGMDKQSDVIDKCKERTDSTNGVYLFKCSEGECHYDGDCLPTDCKITEKVNEECTKVTSVSICPNPPAEKLGEVVCMTAKCSEDGQTCNPTYDDNVCSTSTANVGCYKLQGKCNVQTGYCDKVAFTGCEDAPSSLGLNCFDKCLNYTCVETVVGSQLKTSWETTFNKHEDAKLYENKCQTAYCDKETGSIEINFIGCDIDVQFVNMSVYAKNCFYCECSMQSESGWVLTMYSNYDNNTFSLDACGNCIVNGKLVDPEASCLLHNEINNTAAIAAGTTVGVIVAVLVVAMVIIAIGIKQTVDIVNSARKNAIDKTVNNPEFVEKDDHCNNTTFNG